LLSCGNFRETVELGGLASISPSFSELAEIGARIAAKIIEGTHPRDIPVQEPTRYQVHLKLKTAKALGLTIPPSLLARADEVIE
jgi:putative ABC transport system substrate-binding protein